MAGRLGSLRAIGPVSDRPRTLQIHEIPSVSANQL